MSSPHGVKHLSSRTVEHFLDLVRGNINANHHNTYLEGKSEICGDGYEKCATIFATWSCFMS